MLSLSRTASTRILHQSHRVPAVAYAISRRIIAANRNRIGSDYLPAARPGTVDVGGLAESLDGIADSGAFILARNRAFLTKRGLLLAQDAAVILKTYRNKVDLLVAAGKLPVAAEASGVRWYAREDVERLAASLGERPGVRTDLGPIAQPPRPEPQKPAERSNGAFDTQKLLRDLDEATKAGDMDLVLMLMEEAATHDVSASAIKQMRDERLARVARARLDPESLLVQMEEMEARLRKLEK